MALGATRRLVVGDRGGWRWVGAMPVPVPGGLRATPSPASVSPVWMEGGGRPRVGGSGVTAWRWPRPAVQGQASAAPVLSRADGDRGGRRRPCLPRIKCTVPAGAGPGGPPPCPCPCHAGTPAAVSPGDGDPGVPGGPGGAVGTQGLGLSRTPGGGTSRGPGWGGAVGTTGSPTISPGCHSAHRGRGHPLPGTSIPWGPPPLAIPPPNPAGGPVPWLSPSSEQSLSPGDPPVPRVPPHRRCSPGRCGAPAGWLS